INRAPAKTQAALFEVMEERQVTIDGHTHKMRLPYMVLATQNPIEQEGTYRLPEAQLDRFLFKITVTYPSHEQEIEILTRHHERKGVQPISEITPLLKAEEIELFRKFAQQVHIEKNLLTYIAQIIQETRNNPMIFLGASPRASLAILTGAKAFAMLSGRDFVNPEDIKFIAAPVLRHRIVLSPEKEMEGINADEVITQIVNKIEVPR
ncbi:MAG TPA: MoxR family ATPase, partial [Cyclobacteriaceae bacterium]|nr:MoxR family ATPase [Cyclobacteriaceae bacterium]